MRARARVCVAVMGVGVGEGRPLCGKAKREKKEKVIIKKINFIYIKETTNNHLYHSQLNPGCLPFPCFFLNCS